MLKAKPSNSNEEIEVLEFATTPPNSGGFFDNWVGMSEKDKQRRNKIAQKAMDETEAQAKYFKPVLRSTIYY